MCSLIQPHPFSHKHSRPSLFILGINVAWYCQNRVQAATLEMLFIAEGKQGLWGWDSENSNVLQNVTSEYKINHVLLRLHLNMSKERSWLSVSDIIQSSPDRLPDLSPLTFRLLTSSVTSNNGNRLPANAHSHSSDSKLCGQLISTAGIVPLPPPLSTCCYKLY